MVVLDYGETHRCGVGALNGLEYSLVAALCKHVATVLFLVGITRAILR